MSRGLHGSDANFDGNDVASDGGQSRFILRSHCQQVFTFGHVIRKVEQGFKRQPF